MPTYILKAGSPNGPVEPVKVSEKGKETFRKAAILELVNISSQLDNHGTIPGIYEVFDDDDHYRLEQAYTAVEMALRRLRRELSDAKLKQSEL